MKFFQVVLVNPPCCRASELLRISTMRLQTPVAADDPAPLMARASAHIPVEVLEFPETERWSQQ